MTSGRGAPPVRPYLLVALTAVGLAGLVLASSALVGLGACGLGLLALARRRALRTAASLRAAREVYPSAFEDDVVPADLVLENRGARGAHLVQVLDDFGPAMAEHQGLLEPGPLPGRRRRHVRYETACSRRWGIHTVGPLRVVSGDALGLYRITVSDDHVEPFALFPRVAEMPSLARLGGRSSLSPEDHAESRPGQGALTLGVRDYRAGDEVRRVHWPAFARRGAPAVRELERDLVPYFTLFLDLEKRHRAGTGRKSTLEYLVRTAASIVWSSVRRGDLTQVFAHGAEELAVPPGSGEGHLARALYELIRVRQEGETPVLDLLEQHRAHLPPGSTAALLAGTTTLDLERLSELLDDTRARRVRLAVIAVDADTFAGIERWPSPPEVIADRRQALLGLLRAHGAPGVVLTAEDDLMRELARADFLDVA
jgi:uncharacterized protein (DUF58 family)